MRLHATHFPDAARTGERPPAPPGPADPVAAPAIGLAYGDELPGMDAAGLATALDDAVTVGGTVRLDVSWADVQHDGPGVWDWSGLDRVLAATRARGLDVIGVVAYTPAWARVAGCDDEKCRPASYADFAAFAGAAAARYGAGGIGAWEIWNEPNNAAFWMPARRNKSNEVLKALAQSGGMLGFSLYPLHLKGGSDCTLDDFTAMVARTADLIGVDHIGLGSDFCQDQPDSIIEWMRNGRWTKGGTVTPGLGKPVLPPLLSWFKGNLDWDGIEAALLRRGFSAADTGKIMGNNWYDYFRRSFTPEA